MPRISQNSGSRACGDSCYALRKGISRETVPYRAVEPRGDAVNALLFDVAGGVLTASYVSGALVAGAGYDPLHPG